MSTIGDVRTQIYVEKIDFSPEVFNPYDKNRISAINLLDEYKRLNPAWQIGQGRIKKQDFLEDIKSTIRESVRGRRPVWIDGNTIHINLNETEQGQFHLIEYEEGNYLIGVTKDNKLQMYLISNEKSKD